ncbi:sugar ABC transporter permease [Streptomyces sp. WMMC500]|uniref:carbohydrate ABC transporter permease n=1 Tax=Streptomyces sp. WMMC500 TaxID=3015154 RepID=UPI00248CE20C|nr:sugar ABC transporter permease [Streptomyces sp. WMMC500]WBB61780.1 sugar ABC transporter permease [Streptomyces sp. WMMC500]
MGTETLRPAPRTAEAPPPRPTARRRLGRRAARWWRGDGPAAALFVLPLLVVFGLFAWWPMARGLVLAFQRTNFVQAAEWVGPDNFERVLNDPLLWTATANTGWFVLLALVVGFPVPLLLAVLIGELRRGRALFSMLAYLPVIVPPVVAVLLWRLFYAPGPDGLFNTVAGWAGLGPYPWLQDPDWAMPSIVLHVTWAQFGTATIIYLAALASVRGELYESAELDGASVRRRVWHITLPQLRGVVLIMLLLQIVGTFQLFTEPFLLTGGGPENSTTTLLLLIYNYAFRSGDFGAAAALSLLLAAALSLLSAAYFRATRSWSST